jgi:hypothetical protein
MKQLIGLLLLTFAVQPLVAKDDYPLTIKVLSTQTVGNNNGTFTPSQFGGPTGDGAAGSGKAAQPITAEGSDGNTYELVSENPNDTLPAGTFQAKLEKRGMKVCEPKDNGKCRDVRFKITATRTPESGKTDCVNQVVCRLLQINLDTRAAASK